MGLSLFELNLLFSLTFPLIIPRLLSSSLLIFGFSIAQIIGTNLKSLMSLIFGTYMAQIFDTKLIKCANLNGSRPIKATDETAGTISINKQTNKHQMVKKFDKGQ